jgi:hypothetical protein
MSSDPQKPAPSKTVQTWSLIFLVIGVVGFQSVAPTLFPRQPGDGINMTRVLAAGVVGGGFAMVGGLVGTLIDRARKK